MGCKRCPSGLGLNCGGFKDIDDIGASCDCECHQCDFCGSQYCVNVGGDEECGENQGVELGNRLQDWIK